MNNTTNNLETRVATLEEKARSQEIMNVAVTGKLDDIITGINQLVTMAAVAKTRECPSPGKCVQLTEDLDAYQQVLKETREQLKTEVGSVRDEIKVIQDYITEQKAGWKVLVTLAGAASSCGAVIGWMINHFSKH